MWVFSKALTSLYANKTGVSAISNFISQKKIINDYDSLKFRDISMVVEFGPESIRST